MSLSLVFMAQAASANMPSSCWGRYSRVGLMLVDRARLPAGADRPAMISDRARGVVEVVATWERCNEGKTERCAAARAWRAATEAAAVGNLCLALGRVAAWPATGK